MKLAPRSITGAAGARELMRLTFLGAAEEVTGSCYLVDTGEIRFLIDCGMFQGGAEAQRKNRVFAFDPRGIAFVLLSHAHIDHSGLIPRLVAMGFKGPVYATRATVDLLSVMLPDSGQLRGEIEPRLRWSAAVPKRGQSVGLNAATHTELSA